MQDQCMVKVQQDPARHIGTNYGITIEYNTQVATGINYAIDEIQILCRGTNYTTEYSRTDINYRLSIVYRHKLNTCVQAQAILLVKYNTA